MSSQVFAARPGLEIVAKYEGRETKELVPISFDRSLGAGHGDRCTCEMPFRTLLDDATAAEHLQGELVVSLINESGKEQVIFVGWGAGVGIDLDRGTRTAEFRVARRHYGRPLLGVRQLLAPNKKRTEIAPSPEEQSKVGDKPGLVRKLPSSWLKLMQERGGETPKNWDRYGSGESRDEPKSSVDKKAKTSGIRKPTEDADDDQQVALVIRDLVFNPLIDGVVRGNMHETGKFLGFLDWESTRTEAARKYIGYEFWTDGAFLEKAHTRLWTLTKAVRYLCETLNPDETYIDNPTDKELTEIEQSGFEPQIRNVQIKSGVHLNEALDALLKPLGYTHFLTINKKKRPQIALRRRGVGPVKQLELQPLKDTIFKPEKNHLDEKGQIAAGSQSAFNSVVIVGSPKRFEVTVDLVYGWAKKYDELTELETSTDSEEYRNQPELRDVFRKLAANEAGDYNETREGVKPLDLAAIFGHEVVPRRRKAYPCVTRMPDGTPVGDDGIVIKWQYNDEDKGDPDAWKTLDEMECGGFELLDQEIGFRFTGPQPPPEVVAGEVRFRMTCSIEDDERVVVDYVDKSTPLAGQIWQVIDEPNRFHWRRVHPRSEHFEKVEDGTFKADEVDDSEAMRLHAMSLVESYNMLDVGGRFTVIGLTTPELEPGDTIDQINGRNILLTALPGGDRERYPQITAITWDLDRQCRFITFQTLRDEAPMPIKRKAKSGGRERGR